MIPKLRAWNTEMGEMWPVSAVWWKDGRVALLRYAESGEFTYLASEVEVMLSTGVKDGNGVEVFEGDLVEWSGPNLDYETDDEKCWRDVQQTGLGVVEYNIWAVGFVVEQIRPAAYTGHRLDKVTNETEADSATCDFYHPEGRYFGWDELAVIGNRFQNPELLEAKR